MAGEAEAAKFVPAVVEPALSAQLSRGGPRKRTRQVDRSTGSIEVEIEGVSVRIDRLRQIIKVLQRHRFGRRAETLPEDQFDH